MSVVNITAVDVLNNPTSFTNPFQFEVTFECLQELQDDIEWKVIYVGCASSSDHDQTLEELMVGPVAVGMHRFILQAPAPDHTAIPDGDLLGVTVILITCSYMDKEFIRIGYYVNNELAGEYDPENPPPVVEITQVYRNILADKPVVTRIPIDWVGGGNNTAPMQDGAYQENAPVGQEFVMNEDSMDVEQMQFEPRRMFQN